MRDENGERAEPLVELARHACRRRRIRDLEREREREGVPARDLHADSK